MVAFNLHRDAAHNGSPWHRPFDQRNRAMKEYVTPRRTALLLTAACVSTTSIMAVAQDASRRATHGEISLRAGFTPDPYVVNVRAGGNINAQRLGGECAGFIANAPSFQLEYNAGNYDLTFLSESSADTVLVINGPDGSWHCDDDGGDGRNARVVFNNPSSGYYDVWVGNYRRGGAVPARLLVTELDGGGSSGNSGSAPPPPPPPPPSPRPSSGSPDTSAPPISGRVSLRSGFTPDPHRVPVTAGGTLDASQLGGNCRGRISVAADYEVSYTAGSLPLIFRTQSSTDTVLVINGPDGRWYCDDDSGGNRNALVRFNNPRGGTYDIWVGTYGSSAASAELLVSEVQ
jgi:hypothetical protein